jgi:transposase/very-short-patch-repair endonuclease
MRFDSPENIKFFIENSTNKTIKEWTAYFGCERATIERWKKKYQVLVKNGYQAPKHSAQTKAELSKKRKQWLKDNPDRHPWKNRDKFKSEPCEKAKEFLQQLNVSFVSEFSPQIEGRYFSIDIALPDKMIALEINGNQHYERNGQLKPYYQQRHDLLTAHGWNVFEIHYSACFNLEKWAEFAKQILESPKVTEFDYFDYQPKKKNLHARWQNKCQCGGLKSVKAKVCAKCLISEHEKTLPNKEELQKLYNTLPLTKIAESFGVSDTAIKKWLKKLNIKIENRRGFWSKKEIGGGIEPLDFHPAV